MAKGIRSLLDTVMQALPQVGNLGLLFYLLFFIFAALGVELFGRLGKYYKQNQKINEPPPADRNEMFRVFYRHVPPVKNATTTIRARDWASTLTLPTLELRS